MADVTPIRSTPPPPAEMKGIVAAVASELAAADRLNTALGQTAMALAVRLTAGGDTGSAIASLTRELRATLEAALSGAKVAESPLAQMRDELAERRRLRGA